MKLPDLRQELRPGRSRQPLVSQHETDLTPAVSQLTQELERLTCRRSGDDPIVSLVPLSQFRLDETAHLRTVGQQHHR